MLKLISFMAAASLLVLVGCQQADAPAVSDTPVQAVDARADLKLYTFDCGTIKISDRGIFASDGRYDGQPAQVSNGCFVVSHPDGNLLWDLGLPAVLIGAGPVQDGVFGPVLEVSLSDQIAEAGLGPIDYVSISHSHFDHTGQQEAAPDATWLVTQAEYDYVANAVEGSGIPDVSGLMALDKTVFSGDLDVFGDGSVIILSLPGHTPGHAGLLVNLPEAGPVMLTGDLYHFRESRSGKAVPSFNFSVPQTLESMKIFEAKVEALGARVVIQHLGEDIAALPKPPEALN